MTISQEYIFWTTTVLDRSSRTRMYQYISQRETSFLVHTYRYVSYIIRNENGGVARARRLKVGVWETQLRKFKVGAWPIEAWDDTAARRLIEMVEGTGRSPTVCRSTTNDKRQMTGWRRRIEERISIKVGGFVDVLLLTLLLQCVFQSHVFPDRHHHSTTTFTRTRPRCYRCRSRSIHRAKFSCCCIRQQEGCEIP